MCLFASFLFFVVKCNKIATFAVIVACIYKLPCIDSGQKFLLL